MLINKQRAAQTQITRAQWGTGCRYARCLRIVSLKQGRFWDVMTVCEVALRTRWWANTIINAPRTDGEALHAPLLEMDTIPDIHSDVN